MFVPSLIFLSSRLRTADTAQRAVTVALDSSVSTGVHHPDVAEGKIVPDRILNASSSFNTSAAANSPIVRHSTRLQRRPPQAQPGGPGRKFARADGLAAADLRNRLVCGSVRNERSSS